MKHSKCLALDLSYPEINKSKSLQCNWKEIYGNINEAVSTDAPEPHEKEVKLRLYVYSDHAGDKETWRSRTGFM